MIHKTHGSNPQQPSRRPQPYRSEGSSEPGERFTPSQPNDIPPDPRQLKNSKEVKMSGKDWMVYGGAFAATALLIAEPVVLGCAAVVGGLYLAHKFLGEKKDS